MPYLPELTDLFPLIHYLKPIDRINLWIVLSLKFHAFYLKNLKEVQVFYSVNRLTIKTLLLLNLNEAIAERIF